MSEVSPRFALPLLAAGQAQKELYHNEAVIALENLVQPVAQAFALDEPPSAPEPGQSWVVGAAPTGAWAGQADRIASWSEGGWRFTAPIEGMTLWVAAEGLWARRLASSWDLGTAAAAAVVIGGRQVLGDQCAAIADPAGGSTIDPQARAAIGGILAALRSHGIIAEA